MAIPTTTGVLGTFGRIRWRVCALLSVELLLQQYSVIQCSVGARGGKQGTKTKHSTNMQIPIQLCRTMHAVSVDKQHARDNLRFPGRESFLTFPADLEYQFQHQLSGQWYCSHHWHDKKGPCRLLVLVSMMTRWGLLCVAVEATLTLLLHLKMLCL